jgi:hypothetical protein
VRYEITILFNLALWLSAHFGAHLLTQDLHHIGQTIRIRMIWFIRMFALYPARASALNIQNHGGIGGTNSNALSASIQRIIVIAWIIFQNPGGAIPLVFDGYFTQNTW